MRARADIEIVKGIIDSRDKTGSSLEDFSGKASYKTGDFHRKKGNTVNQRKEKSAWNAPLNKNAYRERDVLCYAEDYDGVVLGNFCVAKGKYLWTTEEDFPLFLLSAYQCGKHILDECDEHFHGGDAPVARQRIQAELTYLLTQQFIERLAIFFIRPGLEIISYISKIKRKKKSVIFLFMMTGYTILLCLFLNKRECRSRYRWRKSRIKERETEVTDIVIFICGLNYCMPIEIVCRRT